NDVVWNVGDLDVGADKPRLCLTPGFSSDSRLPGHGTLPSVRSFEFDRIFVLFDEAASCCEKGIQAIEEHGKTEGHSMGHETAPPSVVLVSVNCLLVWFAGAGEGAGAGRVGEA